MNTTMDAAAVQEAVAAALGEALLPIMAALEAVLAEQRRTTEAIAAIDDTAVGEMAQRYNAKMAVIKGGV